MKIKNRVKSLRMIPASDLRPNPKNWRTHPDSQKNALKGILAEVGLADACLARELPDGSLMLIDGHLRAETLGDGDVPVLILDVNEAEADKILATLDPLAAMAGSDARMYEDLFLSIKTDSKELAKMLSGVHEMTKGLAQQDDDGDNPYTAKVDVPAYEVSGPKPSVKELFDSSKADALILGVDESSLPEAEKDFLRKAAMRHVVFNFEKIANYYAHSDSIAQALFENSACVIVDIDKAIENGWTKLDAVLAEQYAAEKEGE